MSELTVERLREVLRYDPETGVFHWLVSRGKAAVGAVAGCSDHRGYLVTGIDGKRYYLHRLAVACVTGKMPGELVDHLNGDRSDNRWINLRETTHAVNMQNQRAPSKNNMLGLLGVRRFGSNYRSAICVDGKPKHLGTFPTPDQAHEAYLAAKRQMHAGCTI